MRHARNEDPADRNDDLQIDRRSLLAIGGGVAALGFLSYSAAPTSAAVQSKLRYVITDRRYEESLEFGQAFAENGAIRLEVTDGLTKIWQEALLPHWREGAGAISGLTSPKVWYCLAEQARSEARRSALIGRHAIEPRSGAAKHYITAPRGVLGATAMIERQEREWPLAMARLVDQCSSETGACDGEWRGGSPLPSHVPPHSLVSWIIA